MLEKARYMRENCDDLRQLMLNEPRGYPASCCNILLPPTDPRAQLGYVILEHAEYPTMSGSNTICVATAAIDAGLVEVAEPVTHFTLEAPAGLIAIEAHITAGRASAITFRNVPSFASHLAVPLKVPGHGTISVDIAWGGMFFVIADAERFGLRLVPEEGAEIARICRMLTLAAAEQYPIAHPFYEDVPGVTISQLSGPATESSGAHVRNAVTMPNGPANWGHPRSLTGAIDRSPCGTGTSAKMATMYARGELKLGDVFHHQGILGTVWSGRLVEQTQVGPFNAVVPEITGRAWITAYAEYVLDPDDPFPTGYTIGDIWAS
jgi:proline racemase